jgi:hypothetical protein
MGLSATMPALINMRATCEFRDFGEGKTESTTLKPLKMLNYIIALKKTLGRGAPINTFQRR